MGDAGILQKGSPCRRELSHRPTPVFLASNAKDQASPFQALNGTGKPTWTEPDEVGQPSHALAAPGVGKRTQQLELPQGQVVRRS